MAGLEEFREQLVELLPRLRRFARTITRDPTEADDLVQLSLERALLRWRQWQPGSRLDSWMFGIIKNAWIDEIRSRRRREAVFVEEEAGAQVGERSAEQQLESMAIGQAMARLPEEQRMAVALVLVEGLSYKDAAVSLEVPIGTLTSRLARARTALMAQLSESASKETPP
jgi:RNA polymerase sigma-70 factor (ECF subfamily)